GRLGEVCKRPPPAPPYAGRPEGDARGFGLLNCAFDRRCRWEAMVHPPPSRKANHYGRVRSSFECEPSRVALPSFGAHLAALQRHGKATRCTTIVRALAHQRENDPRAVCAPGKEVDLGKSEIASRLPSLVGFSNNS